MNQDSGVSIDRVVNGYILKHFGNRDHTTVFEDRPTSDPEKFNNEEYNFMQVIFELVETYHPQLKVKVYK